MAASSAGHEVGELRSWRGYRARLLAIVLAGIAVVAVGAILAEAGNSLPSPRAQDFFRFCNGKCVCDSGTANIGLMERICPDGWREAYFEAKQKRIRRMQQRRREQLRREKKSEPESANWPSV